MHRAILATLAAFVLAVGLTVSGPARPAAAASCSSTTTPPQTHLCSGTVNLTSGTTSTTFTFSVIYDDQMARPGAYATVTISGGVGLKNMTVAGGVPQSGTILKTGVTFTYATTLPVGSYTYVFNAGQVSLGQPGP